MYNFPIHAKFIDQIFLFKRIDVKQNHFTKTHSLPSHLIHLVIEGEYSLTIQGRLYTPQKFDIIYYDQMEEVVWLKNDKPVSFYTLAFSSSFIEPLPIEKRVFPSNIVIQNHFESLNQILKDGGPHTELRFYTKTLELVHEIFNDQSDINTELDFNHWMRAEQHLQRHHIYQIRLESLANALGTSSSTLRKDCHKKFGVSPIQRMQKRRMEASKGLLLYTTMPVTEIAGNLGYERIHEFSREFSKYFKQTAKSFREAKKISHKGTVIMVNG
jgi:AraC-like DNA-binding protein